MKKIVFLFFLVLISTTCLAENFSQQHERVKLYFQGSSEPKAKDATWTSNNTFKVGVFDDGSSKNGYAEYVCSVLYDYGFREKKVWVQIIDINQLMSQNKWIKLGEARCL